MAIGRTAPSALAQRSAWMLVLLGGAAGLLNGLLGAGGGILLVYALRLWAYRQHAPHSEPQQAAQRDVYATALSVMLPVSIFSAVYYARAGALDMAEFYPLLLPSVAGGVLGGYLLDKLHADRLKRLFALIVLISGVLMIVRG